MPLVPIQVVGDSSIYPSVIEVSELVRGSLWLIPGAQVSTVGAMAARPAVLQESHAATEFTDGLGAVGTLTMTGSIPAGAQLLGTQVYVPAGFAGDVSCTLIIGDGSDTDRYNTGTPSIFATAATGVEVGVISGAKLQIARVSPVLTITSNADITPVIAGAGRVVVAIYYIATAESVVATAATNGRAKKKTPDTSGLSKRQRLDKLTSSLWTEMGSLRTKWDLIGVNILPSRPQWTAVTSGHSAPQFGNILDNTAGLALRTLSAGMVSGLSSPSRPWFMLTTTDRKLDEQADVSRWLTEVRDAILMVMDRSNFYTEAETVYADAALFGTSAMAVEEDAETVIRCEAHPIGSYAIAQDSRRRVNTFVREWGCTAAQAAEAFGLENLSQQTQQLVTDKNEQMKVVVRHAIYPNTDWRTGAAPTNYKAKRYAECYWEVGTPDGDEKFLREGGYDEFPVMCPRWGPLGAGKVWGDCSPGFQAIGAVLSLQEMRRQTWNALRKQVTPPTVSGPAWRNKTIYSVPGANNAEDGTQGDPTLRAMYEIKIPYAEIEATMEQVRSEIRDHFFQPYLTAMLTRLAEEAQQPTASQSYLARDEALSQFVSVIERFTDDFIDPSINRIFAIMWRRGMLPPPPDALQGQPLTVQHISTMAQAQKSIGVTSLERHMLFVGQMAGMYGAPALDNTDADEVIREHAQATGVPPKGVRSQDETAAIRQARAQQQAAAQAAAAAPGIADAAKKLSETKLNQDSALDALAAAGAGG